MVGAAFSVALGLSLLLLLLLPQTGLCTGTYSQQNSSKT